MTSTATRLLPDRGAGGRFVKRSLPNFPHYEDLVAELGFDPLEGNDEPQTDTIRVISARPRPSPR